MKKSFLTLLVLLLGISTSGFSAAQDAAPPAKIMLLGVFHFANPRLDMVKIDTINVMEEKQQAYLDALAQRISQFKPTHILLEYNPDSEALVNSRLQDYLSGKYVLPSDETYQLGFRVAKLASVNKVISFDERNIGWDSEALFSYMPANEPEAQKNVDQLFAQLQRQDQIDQSTLSLQQLLKNYNSPKQDRANKDSYLMMNSVGASQKKYVGADATASWWHRNFRMYANIQLVAKPGTRILVIAGAGHTAILRDLVRIDQRVVEEPIEPYL